MRWLSIPNELTARPTLTFYPSRPYDSPRMSTPLLQGTLDVLILRTLLLGPAHGHAIVKSIELNSEDVLQVEQGIAIPCPAPPSSSADGSPLKKALPRTTAGRSITS